MAAAGAPPVVLPRKERLRREIRLLAQDDAFVRAIQSNDPELESNPHIEQLRKEIRSDATRIVLENPDIIDRDK